MWIKECYIPVECSTLQSTHVLKQHERAHTAEMSFTCSACDKTFTPSNGLLCHKRTQSKKRPLSCSKFDKSFTMSNVFKQDERTGTGKKSFNCSACNKKFTSSNNSWVHSLSDDSCVWMKEWHLANGLFLLIFRAYSINKYNLGQFMAFQMVLVCGFKYETWRMPFLSDFVGPIQSMNTIQYLAYGLLSQIF